MRNRCRKKRSHPFARAWRETELDDEGEPLAELPPVRCPRCNRLVDLGGLDDTDVHRCGFCQTRTRWLWCSWEQAVVSEVRIPRSPWDAIPDELLWDDYDPHDEYESDGMLEGEPCANGCEDPVFGGPAPEVEVREEWVCSVCGRASGADDEGDAEADEGDEDE